MNKKLMILGIIVCIGIIAMIYSWPRDIEVKIPLVQVDRNAETIGRVQVVLVRGKGYHRLFYTDTFEGKITLNGDEYRIVTLGHEGLPSLNDIKRKWFGKGMDVALFREGELVGWAVMDNDFMRISGYLNADMIENIMYCGPASTFVEAEQLIDELFYDEFFNKSNKNLINK